jgi:hypothetical protein
VPVLRKIYFDNARKLLARSMPAPTVKAARIESDFVLDGSVSHPAWQKARPAYVECQSRDYSARPELSTRVRLLWSDHFLYLGYECPYRRLTVFTPARFEDERLGPFAPVNTGPSNAKHPALWDRDVVEAFIGSDPTNLRRYTEFEVAPSNERLDLKLNLPERDFAWSSRFQSAVKVNPGADLWTCEMRIPLQALADTKPVPGTRWRLNLFRCDVADKAFLAWSPTLRGSFHIPEKFGTLEFTGP